MSNKLLVQTSALQAYKSMFLLFVIVLLLVIGVCDIPFSIISNVIIIRVGKFLMR